MERHTYQNYLLSTEAKNVDDGFGGNSADLELVPCVCIFYLTTIWMYEVLILSLMNEVKLKLYKVAHL